MNDEERLLLQATNNRLMRCAAALERIAKADEDIASMLNTRIHAMGNDIAALKSAMNVREELREVTGQIKLDKPNPGVVAFGMFATLKPWLQVLLILALVVGIVVAGFYFRYSK